MTRNQYQSDGFQLWSLLLTFWISFGLSAIVNRFSLSTNADGGSLLPDTLSKRILLIVGIWFSGYVAAFLVGFIGQRYPLSAVIGSTIGGYSITVLLHIIFLDAFSDVSHDGFSDLVGFITMSGIPANLSFLLLAGVVGSGLVALAAYTGQIFAYRSGSYIVLPPLDPRIIVAGVFLPASLILTAWGAVNLFDPDAALQTTAGMPFTSEHMDLFLSPVLHIAVLACSGILLTLVAYLRDPFSAALNLVTGAVIYIILFVVTKDLFVIFAPDGYTNRLEFARPNILLFLVVWIGYIIALAAPAVLFNVRRSLHYQHDQSLAG